METFKIAQDVPTKVICYGKHIDEDLAEVKFMVLVIPGNPGVVDYYKEFMIKLHQRLAEDYPDHEIPVWGISHAGHQQDHLEHDMFPSFEENEHLYNLEAQFSHKLDFLRRYVPPHIKVIGVGHSIGCKTWSELLKQVEVERNQGQKLPEISKCFMLFPTLMRMRTTPNGKWFSRFLPFERLILPLLKLLTLLPTFIHDLFLKLYFWGRGIPSCVHDASLKLFQRDVCRRVLFMAKCEMHEVWDLDVETLQKNVSKLFFYFGTTDGWVPLALVDEMKSALPDMKYEVCNKGVEHAFVIKHSQEMAETIFSLLDITTL